MNHYDNYKKFQAQETKFGELISELGKIVPATQSEDINQHWDLKIETKFDVKALKKIRRNDEKENENIHYVELRNVQGKLGWLYGDTDYFAFETDDYFVVVSKLELQNFISDKCKNKEKCDSPELYKLYSRKDRLDLMTLVKTIDLIYISEKMIKK